MKKVIILSCATGQGHNSCAEAIREYFEKKNISCDVADTLDFVSTSFSRLVSWGHSFMYKHIPGLFGWGYRLSEEHPGMLEKGSAIYGILRIGTERMYSHLASGGYDTVICTHMFSALAMTELLKKHDLPVRTAFVATDYTYCPGTETCGLQTFFIPSPSLMRAYEVRVREGQRVVASGIPVREKFWARRDREEAKAALGIGTSSRHLLVMCGSMGCGPIVKIIQCMSEKMPENMEVTVICGRNERLRRRLLRRHGGDRRVHIVGYTDDVSIYMDAADLYLTKPGGISVTEAAAKGLPMAFINPVSGCEEYNMDFFTSMGAAIAEVSAVRLANNCIKLLEYDEVLESMRMALEDNPQPNGAEIIYRELAGGERG